MNILIKHFFPDFSIVEVIFFGARFESPAKFYYKDTPQKIILNFIFRSSIIQAAFFSMSKVLASLIWHQVIHRVVVIFSKICHRPIQAVRSFSPFINKRAVLLN